MAEVDIVFEDGVLEKTQKIAAQMGFTVDEVLDVLLRKFNEDEGFFFPVEKIGN